jgi:hypothetical protein
MADNRVVIKINYDKDKYRKALIDPKMVTVWHTRRIITALLLLVLIICGIVFWIFGGSSGAQMEETAGQVKAIASPVPSPSKIEVKTPEISNRTDNEPRLSEAQASLANMPAVKPSGIKRPPAIIFDRRVIRASLNTEPRNGEPGEAIRSPVIIENNRAFELFYFSQVKGLKNAALFHKWYRDGNLKDKKQFNVKSNNEKLISSRKLTSRDVGEWQVLLVDKNDKVFSEVNFSIKH